MSVMLIEPMCFCQRKEIQFAAIIILNFLPLILGVYRVIQIWVGNSDSKSFAGDLYKEEACTMSSIFVYYGM